MTTPVRRPRRLWLPLVAAVAVVAPLLIAPSPAYAAHVDTIDDTIVEADALTFSTGSYGHYPNGTSFQQDGLVSFNGYQYASYYNGDRRVCVARRVLPAAAWETACFTDYTASSNDTHNVATLGISHGDGTIHLAFDHHVNELKYRVSIQGVATNPTAHTWSTALFGATTNQLIVGQTETSVTYPRFLSRPDGGLLLMRRSGGSGNGNSLLYRYSPTTHTWTSPGVFASSAGTYPGGDGNRNAYFDQPQYDDDGRLHLTWMWRKTSSGGTNHDLNYAYSDDDGQTWYNNAGTHVATTGSNPLRLATPGIVVRSIGLNRGLMNQQAAYVTDDGVVHVVTQHMPASLPDDPNPTTALAARQFHHYWRDLSGVWHVSPLGFTGSRGKLVETDGAVYLIYRTGTEVRFARATEAAGFTDWQVVHADASVVYAGEPLIDSARWRETGELSVYVPEAYATPGTPSPLHVVDYRINAGAPVAAPRGEWRLDEPSGPTVNDSSSAANHGTLQNGAARVVGVRGGAVQFDGVNDYMEIPDAASLEGMSELAVSVWVKPDALPSMNYIVVGKDANGSAQSSYRIAISSAGVPSFAVKTTAHGWYTAGTVASGGSVGTGTWRHLVGTYDGSHVRLYLDGVLQGTGTAPISGAIATGSSPLRLGFAAGATSVYFDGALDELQLFTDALTASEVAAFHGSY